MKYYVLYNPLAGNKTCAQKIEKLKAQYTENTEYCDMTKISDYRSFLEKLEEDDVLVISGGDGTLNRFVNDTEGIEINNEILYYAAGTGNDFLNDIEGADPDVPFSVRKYITNLPIVEVNGKSYRFLNGVGYGIEGYCCEMGDKIRESDSNKPINYTAIAIKGVLWAFKPANAVVTVDGVEYRYKKVWIAPTMNGCRMGGGLKIAPDQDRLGEDHSVTTVVWHGTCRIRTLMAFPGIFEGKHVKHKFIKVHKGHEIKVEFDRPTALQVDGETISGVTSYSVHA